MTRSVTDQWGQGRDTILQMHREGRLETIPANTGHVDLLLQRADANLATVTQIQTTNPGLAYDGLYDAARFALTAILAQQGLRPTRAGGHLAVAQAVRAQLDPPLGATIASFDRLRRTRHRNEYPTPDSTAITVHDVTTGLPIAQELLGIAQRVIPNLPVFRA